MREAGTDEALRLWAVCQRAVSSQLAYPEVRAALAAARRAGRLDDEQVARAERLWELRWPAVRPIAVDEGIARQAGDLAGRHALRGADAVHLASALSLGAEDLLFGAWDERLRSGAQATGLHVVPA